MDEAVYLLPDGHRSESSAFQMCAASIKYTSICFVGCAAWTLFLSSHQSLRDTAGSLSFSPSSGKLALARTLCCPSYAALSAQPDLPSQLPPGCVAPQGRLKQATNVLHPCRHCVAASCGDDRDVWFRAAASVMRRSLHGFLGVVLRVSSIFPNLAFLPETTCFFWTFSSATGRRPDKKGGRFLAPSPLVLCKGRSQNWDRFLAPFFGFWLRPRPTKRLTIELILGPFWRGRQSLQGSPAFCCATQTATLFPELRFVAGAPSLSLSQPLSASGPQPLQHHRTSTGRDVSLRSCACMHDCSVRTNAFVIISLFIQVCKSSSFAV